MPLLIHGGSSVCVCLCVCVCDSDLDPETEVEKKCESSLMLSGNILSSSDLTV